MARPAVISTLPRDEHESVARELVAAGLDMIRVSTPSDLDATLRTRRDVGLAIIDGETDFDASLDLLAVLQERAPGMPTLMVVSPRALERLSANHSPTDTTEFFTRPYGPDSLRWRVEAMLIRASTIDDGSGPVLQAASMDVDDWGRRAMVVAVFNPKGGVGKTTVATNVSAFLQVRRKQKVLLVDADTVTGHIATSLGLDRVETLADAMEHGEPPSGGLHAIAAPHANGLRVVVVSANPLQTERVTPARFGELLAGSKVGFDVIVVDLHPDYGPLNRAVFERADRILVPVTPDLPAIRAALQFVALAGDLGIRERLAIVVNRADSGVKVADIETTLGLPAFGHIRSGGMRFVNAANEGLSVVEKYPKEPLARDFELLADKLLSRPTPEPQRGRFFGLFGRPREVARA
ncbi:MAG TPA: AAA family ATPase [Candidatus Limnocylindrales bacterium]|nr:AAA family ATPase [Candidatus Limnocylindrales bacterium]